MAVALRTLSTLPVAITVWLAALSDARSFDVRVFRTNFLEDCASKGDWLRFLVHAQQEQFDFDQVSTRRCAL